MNKTKKKNRNRNVYEQMTKLWYIYTRKNSGVKKQKTIDIDNNMESFVVALKKLFQVKNQT